MPPPPHHHHALKDAPTATIAVRLTGLHLVGVVWDCLDKKLIDGTTVTTKKHHTNQMHLPLVLHVSPVLCQQRLSDNENKKTFAFEDEPKDDVPLHTCIHDDSHSDTPSSDDSHPDDHERIESWEVPVPLLQETVSDSIKMPHVRMATNGLDVSWYENLPVDVEVVHVAYLPSAMTASELFKCGAYIAIGESSVMTTTRHGAQDTTAICINDRDDLD